MANRREVIVGAFVGFGLLLTGFIVFLIGNDRRAFSSKEYFTASFADVQGLKAGSPVRIGGFDIGVVKDVYHSKDIADVRIYTSLEIVASEAPRIRDDAVAHISNKGLLGDKMIEIQEGTPSHPSAKAGSTIKTTEESDLTNIMAKATAVADHTERVLANIDKTTTTLATDQFRSDLQSSAHSISTILADTSQSKGYVGRLLSDPAEADRISRTIANLESASAHIDHSLAQLQQIIDRVSTGPGLAHDLIYSDKGADAVAQIGGAAHEFENTLRGVREGNGLAHSVLFGGDSGSQKLMDDLSATTHDLRVVMDGVRDGKGTLGALLTDPSVYEDVKTLIGNVQRNDALRALVRYSIQQDDHSPAPVTDPQAGSGEARSPVHAQAP